MSATKTYVINQLNRSWGAKEARFIEHELTETSVDEYIDSELTWYTEDPDFTPCFLQTVLVWSPCVFLFVVTPLDVYFTQINKYSNIPWGYLNVFRLGVTVALVAIALVDLVMAATWVTDELFDVHIVTPAIKIVTFIFVACLAIYHRKKGIVSSGFVFMFWLLLTVLAIPQYRNEIHRFEQRTTNTIGTDQLTWADFQFVSYMIYFPLLVVQLVAHLFADRPPLQSTYPNTKADNPSPEPYAGFIKRILFLWFDTFAWKGYRKSLNESDIWDINPDDTSKELVPKFDKHWQRNVQKNMHKEEKTNKKTNDRKDSAGPKSTNGSIVPVLLLAYGVPFYFGGLMKLFVDLLSFANPQILSLLINFTSDPTAPMWHGFLFAVVFFGLAQLTAVLNGQFQYYCFLVGYRIRTALISAIYRKALTISNAAKKTTTVGEIVNLMSVDAQRFFELVNYLHILWSAPMVIALCIYFLWQVIGIASLAGVAVMILMIPLNGYVANKLKYFQVKQMRKKDERVKIMNEILGGMKVLKLYAWEPSFQMSVDKVRNKELQIIRHASVVNAYVFFIWNMIPVMVTLFSFIAFVFADPENNKITPNTVFVALSLFNILRLPMTMFPVMITMIMQAWVSVVRIDKFLNAEDLDPNVVTQKTDAHALKIENASFTWGEEELVLKNINLYVLKGQIAAVVGPVGSGKSSLISSILGETDKKCGTINTDGSMAYVAQQAWIQNATLQDNILFGRPLDTVFYNQVLDACALQQDLKILPGGDQTEIGEKGINLSGGQKQRVALARAVYSRADTYLLDDPLSAVDSHVGKHIFDNVLGPKGILTGRTRLLVTHGISYLPQCDNIFVMSNGDITESGQYARLLEQKGAFADFIVQHLQNVQDDAELSNIKEALLDSKVGSHLFERAISVRSTLSSERRKSELINRRASLAKSDMAVPDVKKGTNLIAKEESAVGSVGIGIYIRYFQSVGVFYSLLTVVCGVAYQAIQVYSNTWLSQWSAHPDANAPEVRDLYLGVYGGLGIAQAIALFISSLVLALGCLNAARVLHQNLLYRIMRLPMAFFDTTPLGRIMNRFAKDVDVVDNLIPNVMRTWLIMFFNAVAILVVISISTPIFMAVIIPLAIMYYFMQNFYVATSRQLKRIESVTRSPIYSHFSETITGQSTIRAYGAQDRFITDSESRVDFNQKCTYPGIIANRWLSVRLEFVGGLVIFFAALFAVLGRDTISAEIVGLSITYALQITQILSWLVRFTAEVETNIVANERMEEYSNEKMEAEWVTKQMDPKWPTEGRVCFNDYRVRYREGLDLVLKGITVTIEGGQKVGIVGRTGAGKSSLTLALFRIIESAGGTITIDGVEIGDIGLHSLRSRLTIIPQDPVLFSGTMRMNIDPFSMYTDDEIWTSLEHSHLKAFVKGTSSGLMHEIAEGGENLSIGQRQLVCLARALLRKTKLLILDEATAAVDLETDDLIQKTIRSQFKECTILTIAHRLNTIMDSDKVLVLNNGVVAEFDSPQNLLNDRHTIFYGMAKDAGLVANSHNLDTNV